MCEVVQCREWMSRQSGKWQWKVAVAVGIGSGSGKWQWQWKVAVAVEVGIGSDSRKWDASGIVPEGCQKLGLSLVRRGFSKYNEVACEGFTGLE